MADPVVMVLVLLLAAVYVVSLWQLMRAQRVLLDSVERNVQLMRAEADALDRVVTLLAAHCVRCAGTVDEEPGPTAGRTGGGGR